jgi:hypothetical protein
MSSNTVGQNLSKAFNTTKAQNSVKGAVNATKNRVNQAIAAISPYKDVIMLILYVLVAAVIVYIAYAIMFPPPDLQEQVIISTTQSATGLQTQVPVNNTIAIETGGEYTFSTWIYIANWDYKAGQVKHVFTIASDGTPGNGRPDHVTMLGALYPNENKMMIRVYQDMSTSTTPQQNQGADFTVRSSLDSLFNGSVGIGMFDSSVGFPICDIQDIDLQKWINLTVAVNGRVIDVYVDGKLARSCVTAGIPTAEKGTSYVTVGQFTGWGGNVSTTRLFGYALTPGKIYEIYQNGPAGTSGLDNEYGFLGWMLARMGMKIGTTTNGGASLLQYSN